MGFKPSKTGALWHWVNTTLQSQATNQGIGGAQWQNETLCHDAQQGEIRAWAQPNGRNQRHLFPVEPRSENSHLQTKKKHQHEPVPSKHWGPPRSCSRWNLGCWAPENFVNSRIATLAFSQTHFQSFQSFSWPNHLWSKIFCISADILIEIHRFSFKNWQKKSVPHRFTVAPPTNSVGWLPAMPQLRSWYLVDWRKTWRIC